MVNIDKALVQFLDSKNKGPWKFEQNQPGVVVVHAHTALNIKPYRAISQYRKSHHLVNNGNKSTDFTQFNYVKIISRTRLIFFLQPHGVRAH